MYPKVWLTGYYHRLLPVKYKGVHQLFVLPWTKEILDLHDSKTNIGLQDACTKLPTFVQLIKLFDWSKTVKFYLDKKNFKKKLQPQNKTYTVLKSRNWRFIRCLGLSWHSYYSGPLYLICEPSHPCF